MYIYIYIYICMYIYIYIYMYTHCTALNHTTPHCSILHHTTHCNTLHHSIPHYTTLRHTTPTPPHHTTLHHITPHSPHYTTLATCPLSPSLPLHPLPIHSNLNINCINACHQAFFAPHRRHIRTNHHQTKTAHALNKPESFPQELSTTASSRKTCPTA